MAASSWRYIATTVKTPYLTSDHPVIHLLHTPSNTVKDSLHGPYPRTHSVLCLAHPLYTTFCIKQQYAYICIYIWLWESILVGIESDVHWGSDLGVDPSPFLFLRPMPPIHPSVLCVAFRARRAGSTCERWAKGRRATRWTSRAGPPSSHS